MNSCLECGNLVKDLKRLPDLTSLVVSSRLSAKAASPLTFTSDLGTTRKTLSKAHGLHLCDWGKTDELMV